VRSLCNMLLAAVTLGLGVPALAAEKLPVVATFSILGDMVSTIGGDRIAVTSLVAVDQDAHVFEPKPSDVKTVSQARLVFSNGLGFEGWIPRLIKSSSYKGELIVVTKGIPARKMAAEEQDASTGHGKEITDPHAWQNPANAAIYTKAIVAALSKADPEGATVYQQNGEHYIKTITVLDTWAKAQFDQIPAAKRKVITSHDAFGYFGAHYGIQFIAPQGVSTESDASAKDVANLIRQIKREHIKAVFIENMSNPKVLEQLSKEAGISPAGELYPDALSAPDGLAPTYLKLVRHNVETILAGLKQN
jgi:zinc/manganese transport system substrate-binding protein